jgi:hypothetical protein
MATFRIGTNDIILYVNDKMRWILEKEEVMNLLESI